MLAILTQVGQRFLREKISVQAGGNGKMHMHAVYTKSTVRLYTSMQILVAHGPVIKALYRCETNDLH